MKRILALVSLSLILIPIAAVGFAEESYPPEATRCGKDISTMYSFWQYHIAGTPNPQLTLETGLYTRHDGIVETYAEVLRREAGYEAKWC